MAASFTIIISPLTALYLLSFLTCEDHFKITIDQLVLKVSLDRSQQIHVNSKLAASNLENNGIPSTESKTK